MPCATHRVCVPVLLQLLTGMTGATAFAQSPGYSVIELPAGSLTGLNNHAQVVGRSGNSPLYWSGGVVVPLHWFQLRSPVGINDAGTIAGESGTHSYTSGRCAGAGDSPAYLSADGTLDCLYLHFQFAIDINAAGQIPFIDNVSTPYFWDPSGNAYFELPQIWPPTIDFPYSLLAAVNDDGVVVGRTVDSSITVSYATRWTTTGVPTVLDLGDLGGGDARANGINNAGQIIGSSRTAALERHGFLWDAGVMTDIGAFEPKAINESGAIVGERTVAGQSEAMLHEDGELTDLNSLLPPGTGWVLRSASEINESGQIAGEGLLNGAPRSYLLVPDGAPLPAANLVSTIAPNQDPYLQDSLVYAGTITNEGPEVATGVVLALRTLKLDTVRFDSYFEPPVMPVVSKGACLDATGSIPESGADNYRLAVWCSLGTLAVGESVTFSHTTRGPKYRPSSTYELSVFARELDATPADNQAAYTIANASNVDLGLAVTATPSPVWVGRTVTYTATVGNAGTTTANDVTVQSGAVTCEIPAIPAGTSASCTFTRTAGATPGTLTTAFDAYIWGQPDRAPGDTSVSVAMPVIAVPDSDADGVPDDTDNCTLHANGPLLPDAGGNSQRDTDGDGYGNVCDADLNGSGSVNAADLALFRLAFGSSTEPHADLNGNGAVNATDLAMFRTLFGQGPGPRAP